MTPATLPLGAAAREWDVLVIGAGPAGSVTAKCLADRGLSVLLVDSKSFPRSKVCGGCLNERALAALERAGMRHAVDALRPVPLREFRLAAGGRTASLRLPGGVAVSRTAMDAALLDAAIGAGAQFLPECSGYVDGVADGHRLVRLEGAGERAAAMARVAIAACGLSGRAIAHLPGFDSRESETSRIGVEALLDTAPAEYVPGVIFMAVGQHGYVGLTRVEEGRLNVAAAVDGSAVRSFGPGDACRRIVEEAGLPWDPTMFDTGWRGTARLTRSTSRRAAERLLVIGDAAGYVEPFTGEGMSWAIATAVEAAEYARRGLARWDTDLTRQWERRYRTLVERRQWVCRLLARGLRRTGLVRVSVSVLNSLPWLASPVISRLNRRDAPETVLRDIG